LASYLLQVKSKLGWGQGPSLCGWEIFLVTLALAAQALLFELSMADKCKKLTNLTILQSQKVNKFVHRPKNYERLR